MRSLAGARYLMLDFLAGTEAGVEQPAVPKLVEGMTIGREAVALTHDRLLPVETQPAEILGDGGLELRAAAALVDVLDAQQEPSACRLRPPRGE